MYLRHTHLHNSVFCYTSYKTSPVQNVTNGGAPIRAAGKLIIIYDLDNLQSCGVTVNDCDVILNVVILFE
jgi:hypothetical protein